jgi:16S rRNA (guanine966-N2)-methyltransferase
MRIIAGLYKGRRLASAKGDWLRPTSDRNREFIFSWLGNLVENARVLDLFAGTGSVGIEALSRGADSAIFVDESLQAIEVIKKNLAMIDRTAPTIKQPVQAFLKGNVQPQDLVFADPPYRYAHFIEIMHLLAERSWLAENGLLIYEAGSRTPVPQIPALQVIKQKIMGDTAVTVYGRANEK